MRRINAAQFSKNVKIVLLILGVDKAKARTISSQKKIPVKQHFITMYLFLFWIMNPTTKLGALSKRDGIALYIL